MQEEAATVSTFTEVLAHAKSELWRVLCGLVTTALHSLIGPTQALLLSGTLAVRIMPKVCQQELNFLGTNKSYI